MYWGECKNTTGGHTRTLRYAEMREGGGKKALVEIEQKNEELDGVVHNNNNNNTCDRSSTTKSITGL